MTEVVDITRLQSRVSRLAGQVLDLTAGEPETAYAYEPFNRAWREMDRCERRIVFCGGFNGGKSSLIDALLGVRVLPSHPDRATGTVTRVGHAGEPTASLLRSRTDRAGGEAEEVSIPFEERDRFILLDPLTGLPATDAEAVRLGLPVRWLPRDIVLVDTPGTEDRAELTARTFREVEGADLVVQVLRATQILSQEDRDTARWLQERLGGGVLFAVNRLGETPEAERDEIDKFVAHGLRGYGNALTGGRSGSSPTPARP